jgi:hypothetical protein
MTEIQWADHLSPFNHVNDLPYLFTGTSPSYHVVSVKVLIVLYVTGMVDTFPIRVWKPKHQCLQRTLFTNKYGTTVYKVQIGVPFLGHIVLCTGPHLPLYDGHIWEFTKALHPLEPWEWWLGGMLLPHMQHYRTVLLM